MQPLFMPRMIGRLSPVQMVFDLKFEGRGDVFMSFLLAGARPAAPFQMDPLGGSRGCLAFAGAGAKRKVVRPLRSGSGGAGVEAAGGRCGRRAPDSHFVPRLGVVRCCGRWGRRCRRWLPERNYMHGGAPPFLFFCSWFVMALLPVSHQFSATGCLGSRQSSQSLVNLFMTCYSARYCAH